MSVLSRIRSWFQRSSVDRAGQREVEAAKDKKDLAALSQSMPMLSGAGTATPDRGPKPE